MRKLAYILLVVCCVNLHANITDSIETEEGIPVVLKNDKTGKTKKISLLKLNFTQQDADRLNDRIRSLPLLHENFKPSFIKIFDLGMENVPVLDQGQEPTCITFAVSNLVNAHKKAGDFISQQCLLQFSQTIASYNCPNAWKGSWGTCILGQIKNYGVVNKDDCPTKYPNQNAGALDYYTHQRLSKNGQWSHSFNYSQLNYANDVNTVKSLLQNKKRVLIAFYISKYNNVGSPIDDYENGLWELPANTTNASQVCGYSMQDCGGHGVVITGYDDQRQIFKVRNSWGAEFGAEGDYYMTYDYFRVMTQRGYVIT